MALDKWRAQKIAEKNALITALHNKDDKWQDQKTAEKNALLTAVHNRQTASKVEEGEARLAKWKQSQRKKGYGPVAATDPDQPKTQTKPKPAAKKSNIPGWMQKKLDKEYSHYKALYGDRTLDKEGKSITQKQLKKNELEEMEKMLAFISKSPAPAWVFDDYTPDESAMITDKNRANQMEYIAAVKRYDELADKYELPRFGTKKEKKVNLAELDFENPETFKVDANVVAITTNGTPEQKAALEAFMKNQLKKNGDQTIIKSGSDSSFVKDVVEGVKDLVPKKVVEKKKEMDKKKATSAERRSTIAKARRLGYNWTQKEKYRYSKTGVLPEAVKKLLEKAK